MEYQQYLQYLVRDNFYDKYFQKRIDTLKAATRPNKRNQNANIKPYQPNSGKERVTTLEGPSVRDRNSEGVDQSPVPRKVVKAKRVSRHERNKQIAMKRRSQNRVAEEAQAQGGQIGIQRTTLAQDL